jgi:hypothetical protein
MIGCICCHGPLDEEGLCYICDWKKMDEKHLKNRRHHYRAEDGFPCPCGKPIDDPIHIPRI